MKKPNSLHYLSFITKNSSEVEMVYKFRYFPKRLKVKEKEEIQELERTLLEEVDEDEIYLCEVDGFQIGMKNLFQKGQEYTLFAMFSKECIVTKIREFLKVVQKEWEISSGDRRMIEVIEEFWDHSQGLIQNYEIYWIEIKKLQKEILDLLSKLSDEFNDTDDILDHIANQISKGDDILIKLKESFNDLMSMETFKRERSREWEPKHSFLLEQWESIQRDYKLAKKLLSNPSSFGSGSQSRVERSIGNTFSPSHSTYSEYDSQRKFLESSVSDKSYSTIFGYSQPFGSLIQLSKKKRKRYRISEFVKNSKDSQELLYHLSLKENLHSTSYPHFSLLLYQLIIPRTFWEIALIMFKSIFQILFVFLFLASQIITLEGLIRVTPQISTNRLVLTHVIIISTELLVSLIIFCLFFIFFVSLQKNHGSNRYIFTSKLFHKLKFSLLQFSFRWNTLHFALDQFNDYISRIKSLINTFVIPSFSKGQSAVGTISTFYVIICTIIGFGIFLTVVLGVLLYTLFSVVYIVALLGSLSNFNLQSDPSKWPWELFFVVFRAVFVISTIGTSGKDRTDLNLSYLHALFEYERPLNEHLRNHKAPPTNQELAHFVNRILCLPGDLISFLLELWNWHFLEVFETSFCPLLDQVKILVNKKLPYWKLNVVVLNSLDYSKLIEHSDTIKMIELLHQSELCQMKRLNQQTFDTRSAFSDDLEQHLLKDVEY